MTGRDDRLRALAETALRRATRAPRPTPLVDVEVRTLLRHTCESARERGVRAEELLLLLKETWRDLPDARSVPRHDAADLLSSVITACIDEYYAPIQGPCTGR